MLWKEQEAILAELSPDCWGLDYLIYFSQQPWEVGSVSIPILWMWRLSFLS